MVPDPCLLSVEDCVFNKQGWPEPYIYTVYDRIFGDFSAKSTVYTPYINDYGQPYIYDRIFGDFPAKNGIYTAYIRLWPTLCACGVQPVCF